MNSFFTNLFEQFQQQRSQNFFHERKVHKHASLKALIVTVIVFVVVEYFTLLPINLRSPDFVMFFIVCLAIFLLLRGFLIASFDKVAKIGIGVGLFLAAYVFVGQLISIEMFHAKAYQQQLDVDKNADFYKDNPKVNYQSIPVVDKDSAQRLGDRKMGEIVDYVSQFEVNEDYNQINFKDKPFRVTPLSYSDLIKWFTNHSQGLPAYIRVDMVTQESEVVRLEKGMKYSESDLFFRNIERHLRVQYPTMMFEQPKFEIDDEGNPYWIAPVYHYTIGLFGGKDIKGAVLVNAIDGSSQYYSIDKVPTWVDQVYPSSLLLTQLTNWGKYTNGFLNTIFSQKGVLQPTDGYNYIALNDDVYIYTGLTSMSSDASNVGFALINMRTKEAKYYAISGAEEYSAMSSAEGKVQNLKYKATFPILVNVGGEPTYFMSLKDSAGLVKKYAFVSVENYQIVAVGDSVAQAEKEYYQLLGDNGKSTEYKTEKITAQVTNIQSAVVNGNTQYYLSLKDYEQVFIAPISLSDRLPLLKTGDTVTVEFLNDGSSSEVLSSLMIE